MADSYDTPLTAGEQAGYEDWLKSLKAKTGNDYSSTSDYDMQGAYKAGTKQAENGHFSDQFKKPSHMTFSTDSQYSGKTFTGGKWQKEGKRWAFHASADNLKFHSAEDLIDYFKRVEPDSMLYLPGQSKPTLDPSKTLLQKQPD